MMTGACLQTHLLPDISVVGKQIYQLDLKNSVQGGQNRTVQWREVGRKHCGEEIHFEVLNEWHKNNQK